jgi:hypothetical protein
MFSNLGRVHFILWFTFAASLLVALISLSERLFLKIDLSEGAQYTLSSEVTKPLKALNDPLIINAFLPLSAPPPYREIARHTSDLLHEIKSAHPMISLRVVDSAEERSEASLSILFDRAESLGIKVSQLSTERAGRRALLALPYGVSLARLNQRVVTPPVEQLQEVEYQLAIALQRLMTQRPAQRIGLAQGAGEPDLINSPLAKRLQGEGVLVPVRLDGDGIEDEVDVLLILGATKSYGERARWVIDRLLCDGGGAVIALDHRQQSHLFTKVWSPRPTGLEPLLSRYQVKVNNQWVIADPVHHSPAPLSRDARDQVIFSPHPLYPLAQAHLHPISSPLTELPIPMPPLYELPKSAQVLFQSSPHAVALRGLKNLEIDEAEETVTSAVGYPLAFALEFTVGECLKSPEAALTLSEGGSPISSMNSNVTLQSSRGVAPARLVVIGSGRRLLSATPRGLELLMNSIAWVRGDEHLLQLKQRRRERPKLMLSLYEQRLIRWGTPVLPSLFILFITWRVRRPKVAS